MGQKGDGGGWGNEPRTYRMAFPEKAGPRPCPVEGCSGQAATQTAILMHFWHRHVRDIVLILEKGNLPRLRCPLCNMLVPWWYLNELHQHTSQCKKGTDQKQRCLAEEEGKQ